MITPLADALTTFTPALLTAGEGERGPLMLLYKPALMLVPLLSVFLGMLFGLRYHAAWEGLDPALRSAGEPGLTDDQLRYLKLVRTAVLWAAIGFSISLVPFLFFGATVETDAARHWSWYVVFIAHTVMSAVLLTAGAADMRARVCRPWLRGLVTAVGAAGVVGAPIAMLMLGPDLMPR